MKESQKGQSIVEFAIILPLLVLFMIGLMYFGLMFSNYVALNDFARTAARNAAMISDATYKESGYATIRAAYESEYESSSKTVPIDQYFLPNTTYKWDPTNPDKFGIEYKRPDETNNGEVVVTLTADLNRDRGSVGNTFVSVIGSTVEHLTVTYHMYSEVKHEPYTATGGSGSQEASLSW